VADAVLAELDGQSAEDIARDLDLPLVQLYDEVTSTMDIAATLGDQSSPAGSLVIAAAQRTGRGRGGRRWASPAGKGLWLTLLERPNDASAISVLPLRIGLRLAGVLERWTSGPIQLKWPNDLYVGGDKLGGILIEARWRNHRLDWVSIGIGINFSAPDAIPNAAYLTNSPRRRDVLAEMIPALRAAAAARGSLGASELAAYAARDLGVGRRCRTPVEGVVNGINEEGELLVQTPAGERRYLTGSLELEPL
jgi:BirA family transcriptional regulator, biotin operon repressor / biotin---[acetyl-CoA-carboxylase] ligase